MMLSGLLVEADDISSRVSKPRGDFRSVHTDLLNDFPSVCSQRINGRGEIVNHDVEHESRG